MSDTFDHEGDAWASLDEGEGWGYSPKPKVCKHCGLKNLWWKNTPNGWRLSNKKGEIHSCLLTQTLK